MGNVHWHQFFSAATAVLGAGCWRAEQSQSWCAWTTFGRLGEDAGYWTCGLPALEDVGDTFIRDGGVWGQPFKYVDLAHMIVPRDFFWESASGPSYTNGSKHQDIERLSAELKTLQVPHRLTNLVLEVKCY